MAKKRDLGTPPSTTAGSHLSQDSDALLIEDLYRIVGSETVTDLEGRFGTMLGDEVRKMLHAIGDADAFDVIELMRLRELPISPELALRAGYDGNGVAIEIVALILLARGPRFPNGSEGEAGTRPHKVIDQLHASSTRLLRLAVWNLQHKKRLAEASGKESLSLDYQSYFMGVRAMQYQSIQEEVERALFDSPQVRDLMQQSLGFTYSDLTTVRTTISSIYAEKMTKLQKFTAEIVLESNGGRMTQSEERISQGRQAFIDLMFLPGNRAAFTSEEIIEASKLGKAKVETILRQFSQPLGTATDPIESICRFLHGDNPMALRPLLTDGAGNYLQTTMGIGVDALRQVAEDSWKSNAKQWKKYDKHRMTTTERLAIEFLEKGLGSKASHCGLKYQSPLPDIDPSELGSECTDPNRVSKQTEADALFVIDDVAICVEVKAKSLAVQARRGDQRRLTRDLQKTVGDAAKQAHRLRALIEVNQGLWTETGWMDLSAVREVRSIAVMLDDLGPAGVGLGALQQAKVFGEESLPWVVSLHDLRVITRVLDSPSELLLYVRRRTDTAVAQLYRGSDELDLFMLAVNGGLYVEPDPDQIKRDHPAVPPVKKHERRIFAEDQRPTLVSTFTDPLDAWMYHQEGQSHEPVEKPVMTGHPRLKELVGFLADMRSPGWLRTGADLLSLSGDTQQQLVSMMKKICQATKQDHQPHDMVMGFAGVWGYPLVFAATRPKSMPLKSAQNRMAEYMLVKKHQTESDRAIGFLLGESGDIIGTSYMNHSYKPDEDLDRLVAQRRLQPVGDSYLPIPPSARRSTIRLRGNKKSQGRKNKGQKSKKNR